MVVVGGGRQRHAAPHQCHGESIKLPESHSEVGCQGFPVEGVWGQRCGPVASVQGGWRNKVELKGFSMLVGPWHSLCRVTTDNKRLFTHLPSLINHFPEDFYL